MTNEKTITLEQLQIVKTYIDGKDAAAIKAAEYVDNTIKLYNTADKRGEPSAVLNLPEEMFLDQAKTAFEPDFRFGSDKYGIGAVNPNLEGKPVLVLAVKGDDGVKYSFVSLEVLGAKVSAEAGNALIMKSDGFYVPEPPEQTVIEYATDEEVQALFSD